MLAKDSVSENVHFDLIFVKNNYVIHCRYVVSVWTSTYFDFNIWKAGVWIKTV